jgi:putative membrane protein
MSRPSITFWCCVLAVPTLTKLTDGIRCDSLYLALLAGTALGVIYLLIRPILRILTLPIGCLTLGLFGFVLDAGLIYLMGEYLPGFHVASLEWALLAALFISAVQVITNALNRW